MFTRLPRALAAALFGLLLAAWLLTPASAHADLLAASPPANAQLSTPPAGVELIFNEALEPAFSAIQVLNSAGQLVDQRVDPQVDQTAVSQVDPAQPTRLTLALAPLPDGVYTVAWKAVSQVDGHQTSGAYPFSIGQAQASAAAPDQESGLSLAGVGSKWLLLLSLAALAGFAPFYRFVWQPGLADRSQPPVLHDPPIQPLPPPPHSGLILRLGLAGLFAALAVSLFALASQSQPGTPWSLASPDFLIQTRQGLIWLARLALALLSTALIYSPPKAWRTWAGFAAAAAQLGAISLTSHAAAGPAPLLPALLDWLHLAAMTVWFGGLLYLFSGLGSFKQLDPGLSSRRTSQVVRRFSGLGLAAVALLSLTGTYAALQRFDSLPSLWTTPYGQALLVKLGLFSALMVPAALNLLVYSPALMDGGGTAPAPVPASRFLTPVRGNFLCFLGSYTTQKPQKNLFILTTIRVELVLLAVLLVPVSLMTSLHPARVGAALRSTAQSGDLHLALSIAPGVVGLNNFSLRLDSGGAPLAEAKEVALRFTPLSGGLPASELQLAPLGGGLFSAAGSYLSQTGPWQVQAVVRRAGQFDTYASFDISVQPSSPAPAAPSPAGLRRTAAFLLLVCALSFGLAFQAIGKARQTRPSRLLPALGWLCALALLVCALQLYLSPA